MQSKAINIVIHVYVLRKALRCREEKIQNPLVAAGIDMRLRWVNNGFITMASKNHCSFASYIQRWFCIGFDRSLNLHKNGLITKKHIAMHAILNFKFEWPLHFSALPIKLFNRDKNYFQP